MIVSRARRRAFSLLELAIALVIAGLIAGIVLQTGSVSEMRNCYPETQRALKTIQDAIDRYVVLKDSYPRPALLTLKAQDPKFGEAADDASLTKSGANPNTIYIGAVPFATLGLNAEYAADCWGNKFTYSVREALTKSDAVGGFKDATILGNIRVDKDGTATINDAAAYVVVSHGANGNGAYTLNSTATPTCVTGSVETNNCNNDAVFFDGTFNDGKDAATNFFDDALIYAKRRNGGDLSCPVIVKWGPADACQANGTGLFGGPHADINNIAPGYNGKATFTCAGGAAAIAPGATCAPAASCPAMINWGPGDVCAQNIGGYSGGPHVEYPNAFNYYGEVTFTCANGVATFDAALATCKQKCDRAPMTIDSCVYEPIGGPDPWHGSLQWINTKPGYEGLIMVKCDDSVKSVELVQTPCQPATDCNVPGLGMQPHGSNFWKRGPTYGSVGTPRCVFSAGSWTGSGSMVRCNSGSLDPFGLPWACNNTGPDGWIWN
jgi:prepilin-type N-terminal cleavage/methylation domain-containing protein